MNFDWLNQTSDSDWTPLDDGASVVREFLLASFLAASDIDEGETDWPTVFHMWAANQPRRYRVLLSAKLRGRPTVRIVALDATSRRAPPVDLILAHW
jgi:hypothetical protein